MSTKKAHRFIFLTFLFRLLLSLLSPYIVNIFQFEGDNMILFAFGYSQIAGFGIPLLLYGLVHRKEMRYTFLRRELGIVNAFYVSVFTVLLIPIGYFLSALGSFVFGFSNDVGDLIGSISDKPVFLILLFSALLPAIFEELTYRGVILSNYRYESYRTMIVMNGFLFALMHENLHQFLYAFVLGSFFTYLVLMTRSVYASMLAHLLFNGLQVLIGIGSARMLDTMDTQAVAALDTVSNEMVLLTVGVFLVMALIAVGILMVVHKPFKKFNDVRNEMMDYYDSEIHNTWVVAKREDKKSSVCNVYLVFILIYYTIFTIVPEVLSRM